MVDSIRENTYWHIFFDDGNVLNDNNVRGAQWKKILPQFFLTRFGGTEEIWSKANSRVIIELTDKLEKRWTKKDRPKDFNDFWDVVMIEWVEDMFKYADIILPDIDRIELYKDVSNFVIPQVRSTNEGVKDTLHILWERGYNLYTASGEVSWELEGYILGMECEKYLYERYYGPDLINEGKLSPIFFTKIFQDVVIDPSRAIVIDDNPYFLEYAKKAGAYIIQSHINVQKRIVADYVITSFREIPEIVEIITNC